MQYLHQVNNLKVLDNLNIVSGIEQERFTKAETSLNIDGK